MNGLFFRKVQRFLRYVFHRRQVGFHTLWTRPTGGKPEFQDYELLTFITSALAWRKHNGPMRLYTDSQGFAWIKEMGLEGVYSQIFLTLDNIPKDVNPKVFWAAGKLYAYQHCSSPCVSIDMDAIVWKRLPLLLDDFTALHNEPTDWGGYKNTEYLQEFGFCRDWWNWATPAANMGVAVFSDALLKQFYTDTALRFMLDYSRRGQARPAYQGVMAPGVYTCLEEMIFAEQRVLMMCADKLCRTTGVLSDFDLSQEHIPVNDLVTHLWNSKRGYRQHGAAKEAYKNYLLNYLAEQFPEIFPVLGKIGLLKSVVQDANVPALRFAHEGEWTLPGEIQVKY